jgi:tRNA(Arg) A34 adenosine deaminase TadA
MTSRDQQTKTKIRNAEGSEGMNGAKTAGAGEHQQFMRKALAMAERGMAAGGAPVGACLVRDGVVVGLAQNAVVASLDITAHAEIVVIREACRELQTLSLSEFRLYVTVEPCAMCLAACHYAGITEIFFGADIAAMHAITGNELANDRNVTGVRQLAPDITGGVLESDCIAMLNAWRPVI